MSDSASAPYGRRLRIRGIVQGVGFRPGTLRLAREFSIVGSVWNEGTAVIIDAFGEPDRLAAFESAIASMRRGGARVDALDAEPIAGTGPMPDRFSIVRSADALPGMGIAPDWASCPACVAETFDPGSRRHRYPFTACTDCGPRLSVFERAPYDRANTTLAAFPLCAACAAEYGDADDRRFHAQAIACPDCGPHAVLQRLDGQPIDLGALSAIDAVDATAALIGQGEIVLIKGLGGYQLACDAGNEAAVARLRSLKRREGKPFALMVRNADMAGTCCELDAPAMEALSGAAAPIVLLHRRKNAPALASGIAPGLPTLGVMLPNTPLHHLLMQRLHGPIVLTSGNLSDEPQAIDLDQVRARFAGSVDYVLDHDRPIARRVDDSVGRIVAGAFRVMRRARGLAPAPLLLPPGFDTATRVLALGGDLKNTFALLRDGQGVLSQHIGDLHNAASYTDYQHALDDYLDYYDFEPDLVACDRHPEYASTRLAARRYGDRRIEVGHHHAHIAACLGEYRWPRDGGKVIGIALDGLGLGDDGSLWGGEFLHCDYIECTRVGTLKPMALLGGDLAAHEPWRNAYAQIVTAIGWKTFASRHADLDLYRFLADKPRDVLDEMLRRQFRAPLASSTGRLFDAVAAAVGLCRDRVAYEGEAAMRLEALAAGMSTSDEGSAEPYPFAVSMPDAQDALPCLDPGPMWHALLDDLQQRAAAARIARRFHHGLAHAVAGMACRLSEKHCADTVVLSGGVFQNRLLAEGVCDDLARAGLRVLLPTQVPVNDGGLAWGQALVALARHRR